MRGEERVEGEQGSLLDDRVGRVHEGQTAGSVGLKGKLKLKR